MTVEDTYGWMKQIKDFSNLGIGATDIDGLIEYHNKLYILMEAKAGGGQLSTGQRLALERLCDDLSKTKKCILFIGTHWTNPDQQIDFSELIVNKYYFNGKWNEYDSPRKMKAVITWFIERYGNGKTNT